jgi:hypothetical protein
LIFNVIPSGFEPETYCLEGSCSIQLSYGTKKKANELALSVFIKSGRQDSNLRPPGPKPGAMTGLRYAPNSFGAERGGFEPPVQFDPYDSLANCSFRPLRHLSVLGTANIGTFSLIPNFFYLFLFIFFYPLIIN